MTHLDPEDARDAAIAAAARRHAAAIRTNVLTGHAQTLATLAEDFAHRVSQPGVTEALVHATMSFGAMLGDKMLLDMVQKGIDAEAEIAAVLEIERGEASLSSGARQLLERIQVCREINAAYGAGVSA